MIHASLEFHGSLEWLAPLPVRMDRLARWWRMIGRRTALADEARLAVLAGIPVTDARRLLAGCGQESSQPGMWTVWSW